MRTLAAAHFLEAHRRSAADTVEKLCVQNRRISICDFRSFSYAGYEEVVHSL